MGTMQRPPCIYDQGSYRNLRIIFHIFPYLYYFVFQTFPGTFIMFIWAKTPIATTWSPTYRLLREYSICRMIIKLVENPMAISINNLNWLMIVSFSICFTYTQNYSQTMEQSIPMLSNFPGQPSYFPWLSKLFHT